MKRTFAFCALALLIIASLVGCGGGNKLVGTWKGGESGVEGEFTFGADNTLTMTASSPMTPGQKIKMTGTYKLEGDKVTMTMKDAVLEGAPAEQQEQFKKFMESSLNKEEVSTIKFNSDTEVVVTKDGKSTTFKKA